jgi:hypothetical protein
METLDFRTEHRLSDMLALQLFVLRSHLLRRSLFLVACMLVGVVIATVMNGAPLSDSIADLGNNAGRYLVLVLAGLALICVATLVMAFLAWRRLSRPRQIKAAITADTIALRKDGFDFTARWADADLLTENRAAYLMKFNQLYMRLPKRGFAAGDEMTFRNLAAAAVPASANRLRG